MGIFNRFKVSHQARDCGHISDQSEIESPPGAKIPECQPKKIRIPLNKVTTDVKNRNGLLVFPCPVCDIINTVPVREVHPIMGSQPMCQDCGDIFHIPGGYRTGTEINSLKIYAGLPVAIKKFFIFYRNHPVIHALNEQGLSRIIIQYGIWGFCQKCHHEFSPGVLMNLPQNTSEVVDYRSLSSADEMNEMRSLRQGKCPYCDHRILLVIISEIPHYVVSASENLSHRWEED
ncbi:hypothetical protein [Methanospirillum lacunae]|uniref:Uncharacterized protein n=1 Tax=Methanospirillum lacunae TaxID=668570 RepID=A0A2V2MUU0_9EURY|nr:hypothetical protein [Methanospirillum lacunae]PWR69965.1 hypothetical protein DK846_16170 [Methanospirillum lacunae]